MSPNEVSELASGDEAEAASANKSAAKVRRARGRFPRAFRVNALESAESREQFNRSRNKSINS